ncbi:putative ubiquitin-like-specific protease 2B [Acorus calamus]|uniref:Ubiquitin-like-specific protease 2B n=1 Tax=Acorus calamus TaxID=4465 RepID=A0AAV9F461_ACOCL|nr:putative ubiquitin-like-specific protease 2B [Acorus calamus]
MRNPCSKKKFDVYEFTEEDEKVEVVSGKFTERFVLRKGSKGKEEAEEGKEEAKEEKEVSAVSKTTFMKFFAPARDTEEKDSKCVLRVDFDANGSGHKRKGDELYAIDDTGSDSEEIFTLDDVPRSATMNLDELAHTCCQQKIEPNCVTARCLSTDSDGVEAQDHLVPSFDSQQKKEMIDMTSDEDESTESSSPFMSAFDAEESSLEHLAQYHHSADCIEMDNKIMAIAVPADYVRYGDTLCTECLLTFSSDYIKVQGMSLGEGNESLIFTLPIADVIQVDSRWSQCMGIVRVNLFLKSNGIADDKSICDSSGIVKINFISSDPRWTEKEQKILSLGERYKGIWNANLEYLTNKIQPEDRQRLHFFNSFFFRKLADLDKDPGGGSKEEGVDNAPKVPCILHMDSMRGNHNCLKNVIQSYLWEEWKERHPESSEDVSSKFSNLRFVSLELNADWFPPVDASLKRSHIQKLIYELVDDYSQKIPPPSSSDDLHFSKRFENDSEDGQAVELVSEHCDSEKLAFDDSNLSKGYDINFLSISQGMSFGEFFQSGATSGSFPNLHCDALQPIAQFKRLGCTMTVVEEESMKADVEILCHSFEKSSILQRPDGTTSNICSTSCLSKGIEGLDSIWTKEMLQGDGEKEDSLSETLSCGSRSSTESPVNDQALHVQNSDSIVHVQNGAEGKPHSPSSDNNNGLTGKSNSDGFSLSEKWEDCVVEDSQEIIRDSPERQDGSLTSSHGDVEQVENVKSLDDEVQFYEEGMVIVSSVQQGHKRRKLSLPEGPRRSARRLSKNLQS